MSTKYLVTAFLAWALLAWTACNSKEQPHDEADGHDHGQKEQHKDAACAVACGAEKAASTPDVDMCVLLTPEQRKKVTVVLGRVASEPLVQELELPGEIGPDPEQLLHISARFSGVARRATKNMGERVQVGDTLAVIESNENLSLYPIIATRSGTVIDKHVVPGEYVEAGNNLFVIADLSTVAVTLSIFGSDAAVALPGARARILDLSGKRSAAGILDYVSPFHDEQTRALSGRLSLSNADGFWKPGAFVRVRIQNREHTKRCVVQSSALQLIHGVPHVFIPETDVEFEAVPVVLGEKGAYKTEILEGLSVGDTVVVEGAFELKAQFAIQAMGEGAGCSH